MDSQTDLEREDFIMRRPRAPPTNAAVFTEITDTVLGGAASVYIESLDRFGSVAEARKQDQIRLDHLERVKLPVCYKSLMYFLFPQC